MLSAFCLLLLLSEWESTVLTFVELFRLILQEPWRNTFKKQAGQAEMEILLTSSECRRKTILDHFGHSVVEPSNPSHMCCDIHRQKCNCSTCFSTGYVVSDIQKLTLSGDETESSEDNRGILLDDTDTPVKLYHELLTYRYKLTSGRTCVGSVSIYWI